MRYVMNDGGRKPIHQTDELQKAEDPEILDARRLPGTGKR